MLIETVSLHNIYFCIPQMKWSGSLVTLNVVHMTFEVFLKPYDRFVWWNVSDLSTDNLILILMLNQMCCRVHNSNNKHIYFSSGL